MQFESKRRDLRRLTSREYAGVAGNGVAAWRETLSGVFDITTEVTDIETFNGEFHAWASEGYAVSRSSSSKCGLAVRFKRCAARPSTVWRCGWCYRVRCRFQPAATYATAGCGDVVIIDMAQEIPLDASAPCNDERASDVTLWIPRGRLPPELAEGRSLQGLKLPSATPAGSLLRACLLSLADHVGEMGVDEFDALAGGVADLVGRALLRHAVATGKLGASAPLASFITLRTFVDRNLTSPKLGPAMVGANFGLSRASVYRLFEPVGGLASYIRKRRLQRAYEEITAPGLSNRRIGPIAFSLGFQNLSAFSRAFRDAFGVTPGEARKAALALDGAGPPELIFNNDANLLGLLMQLRV